MSKQIEHLSDLRPDDRNANKGTPRGRGLVETSLQKYGAGRSILVDRNGKVIAGNKTSEAAAAAGIDDLIVVQSDGKRLVVVQRTDLDLDTDTAARELAIADNRAGELGLEWDADVLTELGQEIDLSTFWTKDEIGLLLEQDVTSGGGDEAPEVQDGPTRVQSGELWQLGRHRLLCGDSTVKADVDRLMQGERADVVFTDPPYGQAKAGKPHHFTGGVGERRVFKNAFVDPDTWADPLLWLPVLFDHCSGNWFVMAGGERMLDVGAALKATAMTFGALFTWKKSNAPPRNG